MSASLTAAAPPDAPKRRVPYGVESNAARLGVGVGARRAGGSFGLL